MRVIFDTYEYFDPTNDNKNTYVGSQAQNKQFNESEYNTMINEGRYFDAANYLSMYRFKDPKVQREHENDIEILRTQGQIVSAIYNKVSNKDDRAKLDLYSKVFSDGGIDNLNTTNVNSEDYNPYAANLVKAKQNLGKHGSEDYSNEIGIVFKPKKRTRFGIDWLAQDNPYNIDYFYSKTGFTEEQLKNAGIKVIHRKDDTTELKFDKSHPLANKILYNTPSESDIATDFFNSGLLSGVSTALETLTFGTVDLAMPGRENPNDTSSFNAVRAYAPSVVGYTKNDKPVYNFAGGVENHYAFQDLERFKKIIRDAERTTNDAFQKFDGDTKIYSSTAMPWLSDELYQLKQTLSEEDYNKQAKFAAPHIFNALNSLGTANYRMYSNFNNVEDSDETLEELDGTSKNKLINIISGAKPSELQVDAMSNNGEIGALVTVAAKYRQTSSKDGTSKEGTMIHPRYQVFIPGLLVDEAQARLNRDTKSKAILRLNNIIDWQYDYKTSDGVTIKPAINGNFLVDGEERNREETLRIIDRDIALNEFRNELRYNHTGPNGNLIKPEQYENTVRVGSLAIAAELYPGQIGQIPDRTGRVVINNEIYSINDIFDKNIDMDNVNYDTYYMLQDIYNMYNRLMSDLIYYNK